MEAAAGPLGYDEREDPQLLFESDLERDARLVGEGTPHLEHLQAAVCSFRSVYEAHTAARTAVAETAAEPVAAGGSTAARTAVAEAEAAAAGGSTAMR